MKYRIKIVLCANAETALSHWGEDPTGNGWADECREAVSAERSALAGVPTPGCVESLDIDEDSHFRNWNGGKYAHQAAAFGWDTLTGLGAVRVVRVETVVEDGEEMGEEVTLIQPKDYPEEVCKWLDAAGDAVAKAVDMVHWGVLASIRDSAIDHLCECADAAVADPDPANLAALAKAAESLRAAVAAM